MADSLKWKAEFLKQIIASKTPMDFKDAPQEEMNLVDGMLLNELIWARVRRNEKNAPTWFEQIKILEKGEKLVEDYEAKTTWRGIWGRHHFSILKWAIGFFTLALGAWLVKHYAG
jgi:hypothetical protein